MRAIDPELQARLDGGATRICRCWLVSRRDGEEMGFTDHDEDLAFGGVVYRASSGMDATALQSATGLSVDNAQAVGALTSAAISEEDIRAGKYDGAEIRQWLVDWERPELRVLMFRGSLGEIRRSDGAFEVELRGLAEALNAPVGLHPDDEFLYRAVVQQGLAFGFHVEPQPPLDFRYDGPGPLRFGRYGVWVQHTPGHCPGGVCLTVGREDETSRTLFVGDTLFAGSIGRTDLPGGNLDTLLHSIRTVLFAFPDDTVVYPGHGDATTIGRERRTNPFLV